MDNFLTEPEKPSLLHGDLWDGNVLADKDGKATLIDSAAYVDHAEADLAMTELFGGFPLTSTTPSKKPAKCKLAMKAAATFTISTTS